MKIILFFCFSLFALHAVEYATVYNKKIHIAKHIDVELILKEEKSKHLLEEPAKIIINYDLNQTHTSYTFDDNSTNFPILYFDNLSLNYDLQKSVQLVNSVNVLDVDNDGKNEIFVYGTSHYGGSGLVGKVVVFKYIKPDKIKKIAIIKATDNFEIKYFPKENIIVVAQYIWRMGIEGHYGDKHAYQFFVYDIKNNFQRIPLFISHKKFNDQNRHIIEDNLDEIIAKYKSYIKQHLSKEDTSKWILFVKDYWQKVAQKDFKYLNNIYANKMKYYNKNCTKECVIQNKKNNLSRIKKIIFNLSDFLVYFEDDKIIIEYTKAYDIDNSLDYGRVKSIMVLKKINNNYFIINESDKNILSLKKDLD